MLLEYVRSLELDLSRSNIAEINVIKLIKISYSSSGNIAEMVTGPTDKELGRATVAIETLLEIQKL